MDLYDVYLTARYFNEDPSKINILLVDARPKGHLDQLWSSFGSVKRLQDITTVVKYDKMTWRYDREFSPLLQKNLDTIPEIQNFRTFILQRHGLASTSDDHKCSKSALNVLFIWRRDYVAHPRNPSGMVHRKIKNEGDLLNAVRKEFTSYKVSGIQLDLYNVSTQLYHISQADIYIGMHGAAMTFSMFLPYKSAVIELYPYYYKTVNWHMEKIAKWSGHFYQTWWNSDKTLEDKVSMYTTVPPSVILRLVMKASEFVCST